MYLWKMCFMQIQCRLMAHHTLPCFWPSLNPSSPALMTYSLITCTCINQTEVTNSIVLQMSSIAPWKLRKRNMGKKYLTRARETKLRREQSFLQQSRKRHLNLLFHLGIWQLLQCRLLILSVSYFIHKSRGGRDDGRAETDRRRDAEGLCFGLRSWHG